MFLWSSPGAYDVCEHVAVYILTSFSSQKIGSFTNRTVSSQKNRARLKKIRIVYNL